MKQTALRLYDAHYKKLALLAFAILIASTIFLGARYATTGELFNQGVSLKGGITLTIPLLEQVNVQELQTALSSSNPEAEIAVREITEGGRTTALIIEAADISAENLEASIRAAGITLTEGTYSIENMGSSLGQQFFGQTIRAVLYAFIAMSIVVFITFRSLIPSSFVILAALSDIISTLAVVNLLDIRLSTAGIAAFLMLIGYSVDTDILLTTRVLKRKGEGGTILARTLSAMKTGVFMTLTALSASIIGLIFTQSETIRQIMLIITIGLVFDLIYTWMQNAGILRWYLERKEHVQP
ncbi:protein translocase subunit SecF [Candidatus Woesearchaeota archaeon]|nr:MAG: protein translocase subunit SecF [Candidatus Woesearchaeota archaeon]